MKVEIKVPPLGESVSEAVISQIMVKNDTYIKQDGEILELETDKVNQVLYAPVSGQLFLTVSIDQAVVVGQVIGYVDTALASSTVPPVSLVKEHAPIPTSPAVSGVRKQVDTFVAEIKTSPQPQAVSKPGSVDIGKVPADTFVAEIKTPPQPQAVSKPGSVDIGKVPAATQSRKKMTGLRRTIAERLVKVKNTTAMLTTFNEVDMSGVMEIRSKEKDLFLTKHGVKLGFMSFFVKAVAAALKAHPEVNAYIDGEDIVTFSSYDIGVAVSTDRGLVVPVLRGCDLLSFSGVEKEIEHFAKKAREAAISIDDMRGGSFTITNGGVFGSLLSTPILNPPQSAILGMHSIVKRAVVIKDQIVIRPMMYLALSYDHRIIDGKEAVLFLIHIKESLEDPSKLLLDL